MRHAKDSNEIFTIQIKVADPDIAKFCRSFLTKRRVRGETCSEELEEFLKTAFLREVRVTHAPNNSFVIPRLDGGAGRRCSSSTYSGIQRTRMRSPHRSLGSRLVPGFFRQCRAREIIRSSRGDTCLEMCTTRIQSPPFLLDCARGSLVLYMHG